MKLHRCAAEGAERDTEPPWVAGFGALSDLSDENRRILAAIEEEFETLVPEDSAFSRQGDRIRSSASRARSREWRSRRSSRG